MRSISRRISASLGGRRAKVLTASTRSTADQTPITQKIHGFQVPGSRVTVVGVGEAARPRALLHVLGQGPDPADDEDADHVGEGVQLEAPHLLEVLHCDRSARAVIVELDVADRCPLWR
jgi:predicted proteasome-type protease